MKKQTHHIQKQQVELDFETEEEAHYWNNRFADFYYSDLLPHFNTLLDDRIPEHRSYVIDRLEIDLGTVDMDEFRTAFLKETEEKLEHLFRNRSFPGSTKAAGTSQDADHVQQDHGMPRQERQRYPAKQEEDIRTKDRKEHLLENFYHFLDHGIFLWSSTLDTIAELEEDIRQELGLERLGQLPGFRTRMHNLSVRKRLWFQFSGTFSEEIFNRYYRDERADLSTLQKDLERSLIRLAKETSSPDKIKRELSKNIWPRIIEAGPAGSRDWLQHYIRLSTEKAAPHLSLSGKLPIFKAILEELPPSSPLTNPLTRLLASKEISPGPEKRESTRDEPAAEPSEQMESTQKSPADREAKDDESRRERGDDPVQKTSNDSKWTDEGIDAETSSGKRPKPTDEAAKDLQKNKPSKTESSQASESENMDPLPESKESKEEINERRGGRWDQNHPVDRSESEGDESSRKPGHDASQKLSDDKKGASESEDVDPLPGSEESKGEPSDKGYSDTSESEDMSSRSLSDASKSKSPEKEKPLQQSEDKTFTDVPKSDAADDRQIEFPEELEEYYLRDAGIVLCWPHLERLFDRLEYLKDNTFKVSRYQERAVHLLGYIASGEEQCEEHSLILPKLLGSWPLQMPIIKELKLTKKEKDSADQMLKSLISHWSVLKNTSVEGLRQSFLRREGKLFREDDKQWRLIVEQKSYDMLLDHIPYSIALIKLPWMKSMLKVDWA